MNRWERRMARKDAERRRVRKHGKNFAQVYANAIRKKAKGKNG